MIRRLTQDVGADAVRALAHAHVVETAPTSEGSDVVAYGEGYRDGFEAGEADGLREAKERALRLESELRGKCEETESSLRSERDRLRELVAALVDAEAARTLKCEEDALEMAMLCISRAFGHGEGDIQLFSRMVSAVVLEFRSDALRLLVAQQDRAFLPENIDGLSIEVDHGIEPGACALVTSKGRIETSLADRLTIICQSLIHAISGENV
jgi:flagellar biosynthesis/type III secretory pathway protein FliH